MRIVANNRQEEYYGIFELGDCFNATLFAIESVIHFCRSMRQRSQTLGSSGAPR